MLHARTPIDTHLDKLLRAHILTQQFDQATDAWHTASTPAPDLPLQLHRANFDLWHLEDQARDPHASDSIIADVKRGIDLTNQRRNDLVEHLDASLLAALQPHSLPRLDAPLHSETPGMIVDRLSILSLKRFHMREQSVRPEASPEHRERSAARLNVLDTQSGALTACLADLWLEVCTGTRRFAIYQQMKMYNDPTLNPVLYADETASPGNAS